MPEIAQIKKERLCFQERRLRVRLFDIQKDYIVRDAVPDSLNIFQLFPQHFPPKAGNDLINRHTIRVKKKTSPSPKDSKRKNCRHNDEKPVCRFFPKMKRNIKCFSKNHCNDGTPVWRKIYFPFIHNSSHDICANVGKPMCMPFPGASLRGRSPGRSLSAIPRLSGIFFDGSCCYFVHK